jgi:hypothetical protein
VHNAEIPNRTLDNLLANRRPTNRRRHDHPNRHRSTNPESMAKLMGNWVSATEEERYLMDRARKAGVRRGINAAIQILEELDLPYNADRVTHMQVGMQYAKNAAIRELRSLTVEEVEG